MKRAFITGVTGITISLFQLPLVQAADSDAAYSAATNCYTAGNTQTCTYLSVDSTGKAVIQKDQLSSGGSVIVLDVNDRPSSSAGSLPGDRISGASDGLATSVPDPEVKLDIPKSDKIFETSGSVSNGERPFWHVMSALNGSFIGTAVRDSGAGYKVGVLLKMQYPLDIKATVLRRRKGCVFCDYENVNSNVFFRNQFDISNASLVYGDRRILDDLPALSRTTHNWSSRWNPNNPTIFSTTPNCSFNYNDKAGVDLFSSGSYYGVDRDGVRTLEAVCWVTVDLATLANGTFGSVRPSNLNMAFRPIIYASTSENRMYSGSGNCAYLMTSPMGKGAYDDDKRCGSTAWDGAFDPIRSWPTGGKITYTAEVWGYVD
ncbi:hypothetical protein [Reinekea sp. G2M2-21]|uniref:hypothetical protein n=1 Tax=Reinekea sp. G2M2-21 TaxID=2788942 RepID=UPI0018A90BD2|nr:hypothetical protein [Reinekea sp. G2M2-21]